MLSAFDDDILVTNSTFEDCTSGIIASYFNSSTIVGNLFQNCTGPAILFNYQC